jgi:hypothetical protein
MTSDDHPSHARATVIAGEAAPAAHPDATLATTLSGAPLDLVKLVAAVVMVLDHVDTILLDYAQMPLWYVGRVAYPLFCIAIVANLQRGTRLAGYTSTLLLFALVTQPIYGAAFHSADASPLATLGLAVVAVGALRARSAAVQHGALALGVAAILVPWLNARSGVDFGLAGVLFPVALLLVLDGRHSHGVWLAALLLLLNWHRPESVISRQTVLAAACAAAGTLAVVALAATLKGRPRFLPRYALHVFYPGHLAILIAIRALL